MRSSPGCSLALPLRALPSARGCHPSLGPPSWFFPTLTASSLTSLQVCCALLPTLGFIGFQPTAAAAAVVRLLSDASALQSFPTRTAVPLSPATAAPSSFPGCTLLRWKDLLDLEALLRACVRGAQPRCRDRALVALMGFPEPEASCWSSVSPRRPPAPRGAVGRSPSVTGAGGLRFVQRRPRGFSAPGSRPPRCIAPAHPVSRMLRLGRRPVRCGVPSMRVSDPPTVLSPPGRPGGAWVAPGGGSARLARGLRGAPLRARSRAHTPPRGRPRALDGLVRSGTTRPVVSGSSLAPLGRETSLRCASCELGPRCRTPCLPLVDRQPASRRSPRGFGGGSPARAPSRFTRTRPSRPLSGLPPPRGASSSLGCLDPRCVAAALGPSLTSDVGACSDACLVVACAPGRRRALLRGLGDVAVLPGSSSTCTLTPAGSRGGADRASQRALHRGVRAASPAPLAPRSGLSLSLLRRARQARPRHALPDPPPCRPQRTDRAGFRRSLLRPSPFGA